MLWIAACARMAADPGDSGEPSHTLDSPPPVDTSATPTPSDSTPTATEAPVVLGPVAECPAPVAAEWRDVGAATPYEPPADGEMSTVEPGGVALVGTRVYWVRPDATVSATDLVDGRSWTPGWSTHTAAVLAADLDADGVDEVILLGWDPVVVWAAGTEAERLQRLPAGTDQRWIRDGTTGDYDGDGDVDLVLVYTGNPIDHPDLHADVAWNQGDGTLADLVALDAEVEAWGHAFDVATLDADLDGAADLVVCNDLGDRAPNLLLRNDGGGVFKEDVASGLSVRMNCMGVAAGDVDGDGTTDLWFGDTARQYLMERVGELWVDHAAASGLTAWTLPGQMAWGGALEDMDNDGWTDLVTATSDFRRSSAIRYPLYLFRQSEAGSFEVTQALPDAAATRGVVTADLNADGVLDVVAGDAYRSPWILVSQGCTAQTWLEVEVPAGTLVRVVVGSTRHAALATRDSSFASAGPARAHFGLGSATSVDRLELVLPDGRTATVEGPITTRRRVWWEEG